MPHVNSSGGEDLASSDEIKVYNHEGEEEIEKKSSENLSEDKLGLVTETEEDKHGLSRESYPSPGLDKPVDSGRPEDGKVPLSFHPADRGMVPGSFMLPPYYPNGTSVPTSLGGKMAMVQPPYPYPVMYPGNNHEFASPPPAHMGIPPVSIDPKTGLPRPHIYAIPPPTQFPHPLYNPDFSQVQWQRPPSYPITSSALGGAYPPSLLQAGALQRFGPGGFIPPPGLPIPGMPHAAIITPGPKQEIPHHLGQENHSSCFVYRPGMHPDQAGSSHSHHSTPEPERKPHIKKPLNAFMLFMKEQRATVVAECTLKESAAINQILGRRWHALDRSEQAKYYEMARKEKELHQQLYPGWSARDNYAIVAKKKKRRKETTVDKGGSTPKKCRARFGVTQQIEWCKPCRRKKKCVRYLLGEGEDDGGSGSDEDDNDDGAHTCGISSAGSLLDFRDSDSNSNASSPIAPPSSGRVQTKSPIPVFNTSFSISSLCDKSDKRERNRGMHTFHMGSPMFSSFADRSSPDSTTVLNNMGALNVIDNDKMAGVVYSTLSSSRNNNNNNNINSKEETIVSSHA